MYDEFFFSVAAALVCILPVREPLPKGIPTYF